MGVNYWDARIVPSSIIKQDLEFIDFEEKIQNRKSVED